MLISFKRQAKSVWPLVAAAAIGFGNGRVTFGQETDAESEVAASNEEEASLFDSRLVGQPDAACLPGMLHPDRVFTPPGQSPAAPSQVAPRVAPPFASQPQIASLSAGQGALTAQNNVPAMIGDFFAGPSTAIDSGGGGGFVVIPRTTGVGLMKFAENVSPIPRDRVFVNFSYFDNVDIAPGGVSVRRLTPGFEKTFFDGNMSVEFRAPMAWTLDSTTPFDVNTLDVIGYDSNEFELGNMSLFLKGLLYQDEVFSLSTGLGIMLPTADDIRVVDPTLDATLDVIRNRSVHLMPFIGAVYTPNDRWYFQNTWQVDVPIRGNTVYTADPAPGFPLRREGVLDDPTFLFASLGTGYWIYDSDNPHSFISRVALMSELHFNRTLEKTDVINGVNATIGNAVDIQTINAVIGTNFILDNDKSLILGYVAPLGGGNDRAFDGEYRLLFNWYFGGSIDRASGVQF